jgi:DNA polymerase-3 subunit epsilon/exodeoxyribonuclease X
MKLIFLDTETTGVSDDDRLLQVAYKVGRTKRNEFFNPGVKIGLEAMSVHGITEDDVKDKVAFKDSDMFKELQKLIDDGGVIVAHNARFDIGMLEREGINVDKHICTLKLAKYLLFDVEDVSKHSLQYLRYYFETRVKDVDAHDALGDVLVLEAVFKNLKELAGEKAKGRKNEPTDTQLMERMIEISMQKVMVRQRMPFGKHKGMPLEDMVRLDRSYATWLSEQKDEHDELAETIRFLLK